MSCQIEVETEVETVNAHDRPYLNSESFRRAYTVNGLGLR